MILSKITAYMKPNYLPRHFLHQKKYWHSWTRNSLEKAKGQSNGRCAILLQTVGLSFDYQVECKSQVNRKLTLQKCKSTIRQFTATRAGRLLPISIAEMVPTITVTFALEFIDNGW